MDTIWHDEKEAFPVNEVGSPWANLRRLASLLLNIRLVNVPGPRGSQLTLMAYSSSPLSM